MAIKSNTSVREEHAPAGEMVCKECGASFHHNHWYSDDKLSAVEPGVRVTLCPGCYLAEHHIWNGEVFLSGPALIDAHEQVHNLISNVARACGHDNPTNKICSVLDQAESIEIKTTTEWLAERIGKEMHKAYKGDLNIMRSPEKQALRVCWKQVYNNR